MGKFFATITVKSDIALKELRTKYDLDIFWHSIKILTKNKFEVDGLIDTEDMEKLVSDGYPILLTRSLSAEAKKFKFTVDLPPELMKIWKQSALNKKEE